MAKLTQEVQAFVVRAAFANKVPRTSERVLIKMAIVACRRKPTAKPPHRNSRELMRQEIVREWRRRGENVRATVRALGYNNRTVCLALGLAREHWAEKTKLDLAAAIEERQAIFGHVQEEAGRYLDLVAKVRADLRELLGLDAPEQVQGHARTRAIDPSRDLETLNRQLDALPGRTRSCPRDRSLVAQSAGD